MDINNKYYIIKHMIDEYEKTSKNTTKNKYLVILYGPPSSGKTNARNHSCKLIQTYFEEKNNINETFVNTGIDDLLNLYKINNILINNYKLNKTISELEKSSKLIYYYYRNKMDHLSELTIWWAIHCNSNIYFEIASGDINYIKDLIKRCNYYNYIPIICYPYTNDSELLYKRNIIRSREIGRIISHEDIKNKMNKCIESFEYIKNKLFQKYNNIIVASYSTNNNNNNNDDNYINLLVKINNKIIINKRS